MNTKKIRFAIELFTLQQSISITLKFSLGAKFITKLKAPIKE